MGSDRLAATLSVVPTLPVAGMVLILGVDRFMSECRALTNLVGNGVACVVVSAWERELDRGMLGAELGGRRSLPVEPAGAVAQAAVPPLQAAGKSG